MNGVDPPIRSHFTAQNKQHSEELTERIFHFTKEKIAGLKSKANTDKISSVQAILTNVWSSVVRCKRLDPQEEVRHVLPIGVRRTQVDPAATRSELSELSDLCLDIHPPKYIFI